MARCSHSGSGSKVSGSSVIAWAISSSVRASTRVQSVWPLPPFPKDVLVILSFMSPRPPCANQPAGLPAPGEHHGDNPAFQHAIRDMPLFPVFLLRRWNFQDLALPNLLGIEEINPMLVEVLQTFLFEPFKQHIRILSIYYTYNWRGGKEKECRKFPPVIHRGSCGRLMKGKQAFIGSFRSAAARFLHKLDHTGVGGRNPGRNVMG